MSQMNYDQLVGAVSSLPLADQQRLSNLLFQSLFLILTLTAEYRYTWC
jgi:hypothetical protein